MRRALRHAGLAAAFVLARGALAASVTLIEGLPVKLTVDGDLGEWSAPPSLTFGAADQVDGPSKPSSTADLSAKVWTAIGADGLAIAGEVTDDKVLFGTPGKAVNADHLELWLAFPAASLPPLGFVNQFGETDLRKASDCERESDHPDVCKRWFAKQTRRRGILDRIFVRQYLLGPAPLSEAWASMLAGTGAADPVRACCASSPAVVKETPAGWRFEARIGLADLPASAQLPLKDVKLMVDLVDADAGTDKLETFLSSSPKRKFGEPDTFNAVTLAKPLAWESSPPLLGVIAAKYPGTFFQPGSPVPSAWLFANVATGYQDAPEEPSPSIVPIPLGTLKKVGRVGGVDVIAAPSPDGPEFTTDDGKPIWIAASLPAAFWTFRGDAPLAHRVIDDGTLAGIADRGGTLHMLVTTEGTVSPLGTGACGACPTHAVSVLTIDSSGKIAELLSDQISESTSEDDGQGGTVQYSDVTVSADKDLSRFGFAGTKMVGEDMHEVPFKKSWRWDAGAKRYVEEK